MEKECQITQDTLLDQSLGTAPPSYPRRVIEHVAVCADCRGYATELQNLRQMLPPTSELVGLQFDWGRLAATVERGFRRRERLAVGRFALMAAVSIAVLWTPLIVWRPALLATLQPVSFAAALLMVPVQLWRARKG